MRSDEVRVYLNYRDMAYWVKITDPNGRVARRDPHSVGPFPDREAATRKAREWGQAFDLPVNYTLYRELQ